MVIFGRKRQHIWTTLFLVCLFLLTSTGHAQPKTGTPFSVGAVIPLSGDYAQYGNEIHRGLQLAEEELFQRGVGIKVNVEDGATMAANSNLAAATKLIHTSGAGLIMVMGSDDVPSLVSLARNADVPILSLWDSSQLLFGLGDKVFSNGFSIEATGPKLAQHLVVKLKRPRIAVISNSTTWSVSITKTFSDEVEKLGGKIVFSEAVNDDWTDFRTVIARLKQSSPDALFLPFSLPSSLIACIRQLRQMGVNLPIATGEAIVGDAMKQLGAVADNIYVGWPPGGQQDDLEQRYVKRFGARPWNPSVFRVGYDGLRAVAAAIAKTPGAKIGPALTAYYGPTRSANREYVVFQIKAGVLVPTAQ